MKKTDIFILIIPLVFTTCDFGRAQDKTIKPIHSQQIHSQQVLIQQIRSLQILSQQILSQQILPQQILSQQILIQQILIQQILSQQILAQPIHSQQILSQQILSQQITAYNQASVSKHITAFGNLLLESQGKLRLEDTQAKYIPNLVYKETNITTKQSL